MSKKILSSFILLLLLFSGVLLMANDAAEGEDGDQHFGYADKGFDSFEKGDFAEAVKNFQQALVFARQNNASEYYIDDLKIKLATSLINNQQIEEGRDLLKEVYAKE